MGTLATFDLIRFSITLIEVFGVLTIIMLISIMVRRVVQQSLLALYNRHLTFFRYWVIQLAYFTIREQNDQALIIAKKLKFFRKGKYPSLALLRVLKEYVRTLTGPYRDHMRMIYHMLKYDVEAYKKLKSKNPKHLIKALDEITLFALDVDNETIGKFIRHENLLVRNKALLAAIRLKRPIFDNLEKFQIDLSINDKISLIHLFHQLGEKYIPDLNGLLNSKNSATRLFGVDIIHRFRLDIYLVKLIRMIQTETEDVLLRRIIKTVANMSNKDKAVTTIINLKLKERAIKKAVRRSVQQRSNRVKNLSFVDNYTAA